MKLLTSKIAYFLIIIIVLAIIIFSILPPNISSFRLKTSTKADFTFEQVKISEMKKGKKIWSIKAQEAEFDKQTKIFYLKKTEFDFYEYKKSVMHLIAPWAELNLKNSNLKISNPIANIIANNKKIDFQAKSLTWNKINTQVFGEGKIKIIAKDIIIYSDYMNLDVSKKIFKLQKNLLIKVKINQ